MKLFYYDSKHENLLGELELGSLSLTECMLIHKIVDFMREKNLLDGRYREMALAEGCETTYEDGEKYLNFTGELE